jgi:hypothetical protein
MEDQIRPNNGAAQVVSLAGAGLLRYVRTEGCTAQETFLSIPDENWVTQQGVVEDSSAVKSTTHRFVVFLRNVLALCWLQLPRPLACCYGFRGFILRLQERAIRTRLLIRTQPEEETSSCRILNDKELRRTWPW